MRCAHRFSRALPSLLIVALLGCSASVPTAPAIPFAPYGSGYASKPDFNEVEHRYPLSAADRVHLTPQSLAALDQEQLDQLYARLSAGAMPDGPYEGRVLLPRSAAGDVSLADPAGRFGATALQLKGLSLTDITPILWRGKVFDREQGVLRNRIDDLSSLRKLGLIDAEPAPVSIGGETTWLLFPAKVFCGQSLLDARRESIVADYAFADDIAGYRDQPDYIAGRRGLRVREEMRMVRPGFYLGRAYVDRVFALDFILYNELVAREAGDRFAVDGAVEEACWTGTHAGRAAALR
ncbi:MAG TPA: hypothetical protein VGI14_07070 [Casimicrobiaceae bacterium]|jgi:hypothetical protein